jgi:hypothetical protein
VYKLVLWRLTPQLIHHDLVSVCEKYGDEDDPDKFTSVVVIVPMKV